MEAKPKRANFVLLDNRIVIECPFCGRTLIRTNYDRVKKLFNQIGAPPGKLCPKCGGVAILQLGSIARKEVLSKIQSMRSETTPDSGDMLLE
jgi:predicted RNA-binding Zn-ribbon protein involved in translation (DUF1610 family)